VALPDELVDTLLESIVDGRFPVESVLPSEGEFALKYGMSRFCDRRIRNDDALPKAMPNADAVAVWKEGRAAVTVAALRIINSLAPS
jgi:hypothetical protein